MSDEPHVHLHTMSSHDVVIHHPPCSEFSLENEVFKPIFFVAGWPNHGKIPFWLWENSTISLWLLPALCVMCLVCQHMRFLFYLGLLLCCLGQCCDFWEEMWENSTISLQQLACCCVCHVWFAFALFTFFTFRFFFFFFF